MTVTEESRHRLHQALDDAIGPEEATTLMEHLPPVGWADVATKQDLAHLEHATRQDIAHLGQRTDLRFEKVDLRFDAMTDSVDQRFDAMDKRFDAMDKRFDSMERRFDSLDTKLTHQFWQFLGIIVAVGAVVLTAIKLFGG